MEPTWWTAARKGSLRERGFVVLPGLVPPERRDAALRAINASLGRGLAPADLPRFRAQSFCPELQRAGVLLDLFRGTPAAPAAAALVGPAGPRAGDHRARSRSRSRRRRTRRRRLHPHLDGMYTPENGVPAGSVLSFTMLAGIVLSDVDTPSAGG